MRRSGRPTRSSLYESGAPGEIRTPDPQIRSLVLYPAELRAPGYNGRTLPPARLDLRYSLDFSTRHRKHPIGGFDLPHGAKAHPRGSIAGMYQPTGRQFPHLAFFWPALAAASASEIAGSFAAQFIGLTGATEFAAAHEPDWATPSTIALELKTMRLRDFSTTRHGVPTLLCAPYALHGAGVVDLAPGHSLVGALRARGLSHLYVTHWRSADAAMRLLTID